MKLYKQHSFQICMLAILIGLLAALKPFTFLTLSNLERVLEQSSIIGIVAAGMTLIIISARIDLSVGSILALCGFVAASTMITISGTPFHEILQGTTTSLTPFSMIAGTLAGIACGTLLGYLNGSIITRFKHSAFLITLATMIIFRGLSYSITDGQPLGVRDYQWLDVGRINGFPLSIFLFIVVLAMTGFILKYTRTGRYLYAIGSNPKAAYRAGIDIKRTLVFAYTFTGAMVGIASMLSLSKTSSAQANAGIHLELDVIAAVIIGGASPKGGVGSLLGTLLGVLIIGLFRNFCALFDISSSSQMVFMGMLIIFALTSHKDSNDNQLKN